MTEEQDKPASGGGRWFRLPKLFAETQDLVDDAEATAKSLGVDHTGAPIAPDAASASDTAASMLPATTTSTGTAPPAAVRPTARSSRMASPAPTGTSPIVGGTGAGGSAARPPVAGGSEGAPVDRAGPAMISAQAVVSEIDALRGAMEQIYFVVSTINERETAHEKVFNTLHEELRAYKTDFIYEHLKPVVRSLLFLYDSLEQFDIEVSMHEWPATEERRGTLAPRNVRENIGFFRDQLIEALRLCEVEQMETPQGAYDPKMHKVVEVVAGESNVIQRVVRSGWFLNGQLLRPAEVVIGRKM